MVQIRVARAPAPRVEPPGRRGRRHLALVAVCIPAERATPAAAKHGRSAHRRRPRALFRKFRFLHLRDVERLEIRLRQKRTRLVRREVFENPLRAALVVHVQLVLAEFLELGEVDLADGRGDGRILQHTDPSMPLLDVLVGKKHVPPRPVSPRGKAVGTRARRSRLFVLVVVCGATRRARRLTVVLTTYRLLQHHAALLLELLQNLPRGRVHFRER
mmetsp:Transcript_9615/g.23618  ORF Transcript_9615/g.23618 Transcript_9615/m.23618 type:complete len:216 (-) Transcript_9615:2803-3450(-)